MQIIWSQIFVDCSPEPFPLQSVTANHAHGATPAPCPHAVYRRSTSATHEPSLARAQDLAEIPSGQRNLFLRDQVGIVLDHG